MTTQTHSNNTTLGMVQAMRAIREEISKEIKDMTFEEERAYLDKLLAPKEQQQAANNIAALQPPLMVND